MGDFPSGPPPVGSFVSTSATWPRTGKTGYIRRAADCVRHEPLLGNRDLHSKGHYAKVQVHSRTLSLVKLDLWRVFHPLVASKSKDFELAAILYYLEECKWYLLKPQHLQSLVSYLDFVLCFFCQTIDHAGAHIIYR
jgi:hypothetical protein